MKCAAIVVGILQWPSMILSKQAFAGTPYEEGAG